MSGDWMACDEAGLPVGRIMDDVKTMTERDWLECDNHQTMLAFLATRGASDRKLRLFACACSRRIWHQLKRIPSKHAVEVAERYADGLATEKELTIARKAAQMSWDTARNSVVQGNARQAATYTASKNRDQLAYVSTAAYLGVSQSEAARNVERAAHPHRLRCIFGNPYRPPFIASPDVLSHNDAAAVKLGMVIYEDRTLPSGELDPVRLAILADALEDAGCDDAELLGHLREPGPHARGCWAVDAVLGRS